MRPAAARAIAGAARVSRRPRSAEEQLLTLYSPPIDSEPYVHKSTTVPLKPDGKQAPARARLRARLPGAGAGGQQGPGRQAAAGGQDDGPPLPLLHGGPRRSRPGRLPRRRVPRRARGGAPERAVRQRLRRPSMRARYGIHNATPQGQAPGVVADRDGHEPLQALQALLRAHEGLVHDRAARRRSTRPTVGNCAHLANGMAYDVPGGGVPGSTFVDRSTWTVPFSGRILGGASHHHGGAMHQTLTSADLRPHAVRRQGLLRRRRPPVQHDPPDPARAGADRQRHVPHARRASRSPPGEVLERAALHDNATLHVAAMGFWVPAAGRATTRVTRLRADADRRARGHRARRSTTSAAPYVFDRDGAAAAAGRAGAGGRSTAPIAVGDQCFRPPRLTAKVGQRLTWRFTGVEPHSVTVANGPRGFSSNYLGNVTRRAYSFTPTVPGTYRLTCLIHPTTMAQTLQRQTLLKKFSPRSSSRSWALMFSLRELAGEQQQAHRDQDHAGERGDDQVVVAQPAERGRHARERDRGEQERDREPERVEREQDRRPCRPCPGSRRRSGSSRASGRCTASRRPRTRRRRSAGRREPARLISASGRHSRFKRGTNGVSRKKTPSAMITAPAILSSVGAWSPAASSRARWRSSRAPRTRP